MNLGEKYRDTVTGFEGVVTGRAEYLYETSSAQLTRPDSTGKPESVWIPEARLEPIEKDTPGFGT